MRYTTSTIQPSVYHLYCYEVYYIHHTTLCIIIIYCCSYIHLFMYICTYNCCHTYSTVSCTVCMCIYVHIYFCIQREKKKYDGICKEAYEKAPKIIPYHRDWLDSPWKGDLSLYTQHCACNSYSTVYYTWTVLSKFRMSCIFSPSFPPFLPPCLSLLFFPPSLSPPLPLPLSLPLSLSLSPSQRCILG